MLKRRQVWCMAPILSALLLVACVPETDYVPYVIGGDVDRGRAALDRYECGVCHVIPGIADAVGQVGPALDNYSKRPYIAGKFPNQPETLMRWIRDPPEMAPQTQCRLRMLATSRRIYMSPTEMQPRPSSSAIHPAADSGAELIDQLGTVLYIGGGVIFLVVMTLAIYGVYAKGRAVDAQRWVVGGGLIFPAVTLTVLLVYSLAVGNGLMAIGSSNALQLFLDCFGVGGSSQSPSNTASDAVLRVHVIGKQWWWEVRYDQPGSTEQIVLANEVRIPTDRAVELVLSSTDVIHSFWAPSLAGKVDMIPGRTTRLRLQTSEEGTFRAVCAEYCGGQHALMALIVVTQDVAEFNTWLAQQRRPATMPSDPLLQAGLDAFFKGECDTCHTVRGIGANATVGPDLTHVGGRKSLGAGILNNHIGTMAGWIAGPQEVKPGNKMPETPIYTGTELRALSAWLGSLE
jgi:cytochrome c oxidase subunit II